ncbi:MAG: 4Fe-4S dicluster domain-containing protein, partial [Chloroflexi bacterium]
AVVGISGANMAIAETGTVVLVTNEGNADLTVTLPPVHIALFGMDKLIASYEDAIAQLRMLTRSGTGQRITSYVNWITGPSRSADIEQSLTIGVHGPREMHCVILDNGRERMRDDPIFRDALTCIRCGACSNACPPFMAVGGHQFGHIYNGPIGLVLTPFHHGLAEADLPNTLCTQCNACQEACPVDIPLPRQILEHRRRGRKSLRKRALLGLWGRPALADRVLRTGAPFTGALAGTPKLAGRPYRDRAPRPSGRGEPLTIFASCMADRALPEAAVALERIAAAAGFDVGFPKGQWCCGLIAANGGQSSRHDSGTRPGSCSSFSSSGPSWFGAQPNGRGWRTTIPASPCASSASSESRGACSSWPVTRWSTFLTSRTAAGSAGRSASSGLAWPRDWPSGSWTRSPRPAAALWHRTTPGAWSISPRTPARAGRRCASHTCSSSLPKGWNLRRYLRVKLTWPCWPTSTRLQI